MNLKNNETIGVVKREKLFKHRSKNKQGKQQQSKKI